MDRVVLSVNNVSKYFMVSTENRTLLRLFQRAITGKPYHKKLWALKEVNFEIKEGEALGVIGNNGAGKTTLLKIISGIYRQASGTVKVNGTVSAFLQLGIGMHRDLSALENIYLFGAIMGLSRKEVTGKLNSIIDFSALKDFIHTPLRDFSIGMAQRLAISIAKETGSQVLVLDDILAGADADFVEKCVKFFKKRKSSKGAIIISSHSLDMIKRTCDKALFLDKGRQVAFGPAEEIINIYRKHQ